MRKTFKYRIYPTKSQATLLNKMLEGCRYVYNETLSIRKNSYETSKKSISLYDTNKLLTQWKKDKPELTLSHSQVLQNVQVRVDLAFKAFFRRCKAGENPGYPRFKGRGRYTSITYTQYTGGNICLKESILTLSKIGDIKIICHRPIDGKIKTITLIKSATNKWYASISVEGFKLQIKKTLNKAIGIDVGLESFATFSTGEKIPNPRFFRQEEKALTKAQSKKDKFEKGSLKRKKKNKVVTRIYERISFKRVNFIHQISKKLVNEFSIIAIEDLNIRNMIKNHCLAKSISDVSWNMFFNILINKAEYADCQVIKVNPRNTSKRCSRCGTIVEKSLSNRIHSCPICNLVLDRDVNASINILALGIQGLDLIPRSPHL